MIGSWCAHFQRATGSASASRCDDKAMRLVKGVSSPSARAADWHSAISDETASNEAMARRVREKRVESMSDRWRAKICSLTHRVRGDNPARRKIGNPGSCQFSWRWLNPMLACLRGTANKRGRAVQACKSSSLPEVRKKDRMTLTCVERTPASSSNYFESHRLRCSSKKARTCSGNSARNSTATGS